MTFKKEVGHPLKFPSVTELQKKINKYFLDCETKEKPLTITGLALALDTTRDVLLDYENFIPERIKNKPEYSHTIKKAKLMCHNFAEQFLFTGKNVVGAIFNLKNNYGWKDSVELGNQNGNPFKIKVETDEKT